LEEDDCDSVASDDDIDSDYLEEIETETVDLGEQFPLSKRRKRNQQLDAELPQSLGTDPSLPSASQCDHCREPAWTGFSLGSEPIPVQGFLTRQNHGSDII
jgi:hypothetical protein